MSPDMHYILCSFYSTRSKGNRALKCFLLLLSLSFLLLLPAACSDDVTSQTATTPLTPAPTFAQAAHTTRAISAQGSFEEFPLPQDHSSMMRPVVDHQGRVWFGEMGRNYLTFFDPRTQTFQQITPPRGANGIMGIAVASDDTIWFAEQYANYIGHYLPATGRYQLYDLPLLHLPDPGNKTKTLTLPSAPNDLVLDKQGNVWFTEMNADAIGMLNTRTGQFTHYPVSSPRTIQVRDPYGITIDPQGTIWFTEASTIHLGRLDPRTGTVTYYTPKASEPLMEVASDSHGFIWTTSFGSGLLLKFMPSTAQFTSYVAPNNSTNAGALYGLTISPKDEIWVTITSASTIARLDVAANHFLYYPIPTGSCLPLGIAMDNQHTLWFTESGTNILGKLLP